MWEKIDNRSSQSCTAFHKRKNDLMSVEYKNYIHKDVLNYLDQYPMRKSNQKPKKGSPKTRTRTSNCRNANGNKPTSPVDCHSGFKPKESCNPPRPPSGLLSKLGPICHCAPKQCPDPRKPVAYLQLTAPPKKMESVFTKTCVSPSSFVSPNQSGNDEETSTFRDIDAGSFVLKHADFSPSPIPNSTVKNGWPYEQKTIENVEVCLNRNASDNDKPDFFKEYLPPWRIYKYGEKGSGTRTRSGEAQDFYKIRDECLENGTLFEDTEFPATDSSLFFSQRPDRYYEWKRPSEICDNPQFFVEGYSRFDVQQGELGDCWLLAAAANLTLYRRLFFQIVPDDQDFDEKYAGVFHFRFWQYGKWVDVVIDDRLPTYRGELIFLHSTEENEFWSALLEKAYAKLHGSYEALKGGSTCEAMEDFTGGVTEMYELDSPPPNLFQIVLKAYERSSLMGCSIEPDPSVFEAQTPEGLIRGHAYSITRVQYVDIQTPNVSGKIPLLRLRNPWGNESEWNGAWSDGAPEWRFISESEREEIGLTFDNDGEFWMSFKDFQHHFSRLEICNLNPDSLSEEELKEGNKKTWEMSVYEGEWVRGVSAGGCRNFIDTFSHNPQYRISLTEVDEGDDESECTMIVALMQKNRRHLRVTGGDLLTIGFAIYHLPYPDRVPKPLDLNFFKYNASVARSPSFINLREVSCRFKLPPGTYCIVPSTFDPNEEGEFLLRVFTENKNIMEYDGYNDNTNFRTIRSNDIDEEEEEDEDRPSAPSFPAPPSPQPYSSHPYPQSPGFPTPQSPGYPTPQSPGYPTPQPGYPGYPSAPAGYPGGHPGSGYPGYPGYNSGGYPYPPAGNAGYPYPQPPQPPRRNDRDPISNFFNKLFKF